MRMDRTIKEPGPPATPSWDNRTLRERIEEPPAPRAGLDQLRALARERSTATESRKGKHARRRRRRRSKAERTSARRETSRVA